MDLFQSYSSGQLSFRLTLGAVVKSLLKKALDLFFLCRPILLVPAWGFAVLGWYRAQTQVNHHAVQNLWKVSSWGAFIWILVFSAAVAAVYVINQIADREVDAKNDGFPLLVKAGLSNKAAWVTTVLLSVVGIVLSLCTGRILLALLGVATLIVGYVYSCKPFSFSGRPILDFVSNALGYGIIAFGAGYSCVTGAQGMFTTTFIVDAAPYFFLMCAGSISSTLPDIPGDKIGGKITTAVALGPLVSHCLAMAFLACAGIIGYMGHDWIALLGVIISAPLYFMYLINPSRIWMEATYKAGGGSLMILASLLMPLTILASLAILLATWLYFRIRHGVSYPSLVPMPVKSNGPQ